MNDISPVELVILLLASLSGRNPSDLNLVAPHLTVFLCAATGAFMGRDRSRTATRIEVLKFVIGMAFVSWLFTSTVINAAHTLFPGFRFDDRLWMGPVSWLIAFVGLRWKPVLLSGVEFVQSHIRAKSARGPSSKGDRK